MPDSDKAKLKAAGPKTEATVKTESAVAKDKLKQAGPKARTSVLCASGRTKTCP